MADIKVFRFDDSDIRVIEKDGNPWWVLKDVCDVLELSNSRVVADRLDKDEVSLTYVTDSLGREQQSNIINESGLYSTILLSRKPEAKRFKRWITSEVLPSIRKHGAYMTGDTLNKMIASPEFGIQLLTALKDEQNKNLELQAENSTLTVQNAIMQPKADYFDELAKRNLSLSFRETAKALNVKEKDFINFLLDKRYIYRNKKGQLCPYSERNNGYFEIKTFYNNATDWTGFQTLVTLKGIDHFRMICRGNLTAVWEDV